MTPIQLDSLLVDLKLTRDWLAGATGISRRTLEGWKYKGAIPANKVPVIEQALTNANKARVSLTFEEWETVVKAMRLAGYHDFDLFLKDIVMEKANDIDRALPTLDTSVGFEADLAKANLIREKRQQAPA
jgi:hypothetical protein